MRNSLNHPYFLPLSHVVAVVIGTAVASSAMAVDIIVPGVLNDHVTTYNALALPHPDFTNTPNRILVGTLPFVWIDANGNDKVDPGEEQFLPGNGVFTQTGSTITVFDDVILASADQSGTYNLNAGVLDVAQSTQVGFSGNGLGVFNHHGGSHFANILGLGSGNGARGEYHMSGGLLDVGSLSVGFGGSGFFQQTSGIVDVAGSLAIDNHGPLPTASEYVISGTSELHVGTNIAVGIDGDGSVMQTNALVDVGNDLRIGRDSTGVGSYSNFNGDLNVVGNLHVGDSGDGIFTQTGASSQVTVGNNLRVGRFGGSVGEYHLTDGSLDVGQCTTCTFDQDSLDIGVGGDGTFNQHGASSSVTVASEIHLGSSGGMGTYNLFDGTLVVGDDAKVGDFHGIGLFNQSGGGVTVQHDLIVGHVGNLGAVDNGTYDLSNGAAVHVWDDLIVGDKTNGVFRQHWGTVTVDDELYLGDASTGNGFYQLVDGLLQTRVSRIGDDGMGTFEQLGGEHRVAEWMAIGQDSASDGEYTLSGGLLQVGSTLYLADDSPNARGKVIHTGGELRAADEQLGDEGFGRFEQSGGMHIVSGDVSLGEQDAGQGEYDISAGIFDIGDTLYLGDNGLNTEGQLVQTGGQVSASHEQIGDEGFGLYRQSGGLHTVSGTMFVGEEATGRGFYEMMPGGDLLALNATIGNHGEGTVTQTGGTIRVENELRMGEFAGSSGQFTLNAGTLFSKKDISNLNPLAESAIVGVAGNARFDQNGGRHEVGRLLVVGGDTSGIGDYFLNGGELDADTVIVGDFGRGAFTHGSGFNTVHSDLVLGNELNSDGRYTLTGPGELIATREIIGGGGQGAFQQDGGVNRFGAMVIGFDAGSDGRYVMTGGSFGVPHLASSVIVGESGDGTFEQSGGRVDILGPLSLGRDHGATGLFRLLAGGDLNTSNTIVGDAGSGRFEQQDGIHRVSGDLRIGEAALTGLGDYQMFAGTLETGDVFLGARGTGVFEQQGGSHTVGFEVSLAEESDGHGTYRLFDGSLKTNHLHVGKRGVGEFVQEAGSNTVDFSLTLGDVTNASTGSYDLNGGTLNASDEIIGGHGSGQFIQRGGSNTAAFRFVLGESLDGHGSYELVAGDLLAVDETIGHQGRGDFIQRGGRNILAGDLTLSRVLGGRSSYLLEDGELAAKNVTVAHSGEAAFTQTGGTNTVADTLSVVRNGAIVGEYNLSGGILDVNTVDISSGGLFNFTGGELAVDLFRGDLSNAGGTLAPGNSPGMTTIDGNFSQAASGVLEIEIGGAVPGVGYDVLNVHGTAMLGGKLDLLLWAGYLPGEGESFDILTADSIVGVFDTVAGLSITPGLRWQLDYDLGGVAGDVLRITATTAVPLPSAIWLLFSALAAVPGMAKRRQRRI